MLKEWLPLLPYGVKAALSWKRPAITLSILCLSHRKYPKVTYCLQEKLSVGIYKAKTQWSKQPRRSQSPQDKQMPALSFTGPLSPWGQESKNRTVSADLWFSSWIQQRIQKPPRKEFKLKLFKTYSINNVMFQRVSLYVAKWKSDNYIENLGGVFFLV